MTKVFVIQEPLPKIDIDINTARGYGEIVYILSESIRPHNHQQWYINKLKEAFETIEEGDYVALVGNRVICAVGLAIAIDEAYRKNITTIKLLSWGAANSSPLEIELHEPFGSLTE
jgi:hypothetical protein